MRNLHPVYRFTLALAFLLPLSSGCSMCQSTDDYAYGYFGGTVPRTNQTEGRVNSVLDPRANGGAILAEGEYIEEGELLDEQPLPAGDADPYMTNEWVESW
jgi:hypothetical protein